MDVTITKMLSIHIDALLPPTSAELDLHHSAQVAAILGVGLLYQGTAQRRMAEVLLSEIGDELMDFSHFSIPLLTLQPVNGEVCSLDEWGRRSYDEMHVDLVRSGQMRKKFGSQSWRTYHAVLGSRVMTQSQMLSCSVLSLSQ